MTEKTQIIYTIVDDVEVEIHMFAAKADELAKDVVASFLSAKVIPNTFPEGMESSGAKDMLTAISASSSIEELTRALNVYDLRLAILAV